MSKTFEEILDDMCKRVSNVSTMEGSFIYTALAPFAMELAELYLQLEYDEENNFADTADFDHLKLLAKDRGLTPYSATSAIGIGEFDQKITSGSRFTINTYTYTSGDFIEEKDGYYYYKMTSTETGSDVNKYIGRLTPIDYTQDLTHSYLTKITTPAEDEESVEDFRERYFNSFNKKSFGGNKADYKEKIKSISGVGDCKIIPIWNGGGTVKIIVINSEYEKPSDELIKAIQIEIDPQQDGLGDGYAPIGHKVTIESVKEKEINIKLKITYEDGYTFDDIKDEITSVIKSYFKDLNSTWADEENLVVRVSKIINIVLGVKGVLDVSNVLINDSSANLSLDSNAISTLTNVEEESV